MGRDGAGAGTVLLAFIVGAVSGAAVALLYAPATGEETREQAAAAAEKGRQVLKQGRDTLATAVERGREAYQQARARENA